MAKMKKNRKKAGGIDRRLLFASHPFFLTAYPVLALFAYNVKEAYVGSLLNPLFFSLSCTLILFLILGLTVKNWFKAALITSAAAAAFFSYGHAYNTLNDVSIGDLEPFNIWTIFAAYTVVCGLAIKVIVGLDRDDLLKVSQVVTFMAMVLFCLSGYQSVDGIVKYHQKLITKYNNRIGNNPVGDRYAGIYPDIYYILLDGHARADTMSELYGYDDSRFIKALKERGFFVADRSRSNYDQTLLSVTSIFNMDYLDQLKELKGISKGRTGEAARVPVGELFRRNRLREFLDQYGYKFVSYFSGYEGTELMGIADVYLPGRQDFAGDISQFSSVFMDTTMLKGLQEMLNIGLKEKIGPHIAYRRRTQYILENLQLSAGIKSPKIVFAHIICPHPPFVFDENGPSDRYIDPKYGLLLGDGSDSRMPKEDYKKAYSGQARFIDGGIPGAIDRLFAAYAGKTRPIVIIQADHGPGMGLDWKSFEKTDLKERFSVLSAIYLPGGDKKHLLYGGMSNVNTFRVVLDTYFNGNLPILSDSSYYSTWKEPLKFMRVPEEKVN